MNFDVIKSNKIFNGKVFDVKVDEIRYHESGNLGIREVAIHPGGAVVVPVSKDGKIFLISQYRYPMNETTIELPAGKLEKNEDPLIAAQRELKEETGLNGNQPTLFDVKIHLNGYYGDILIVIYRMILQSFEILPGDDVQDARFFKIDERPQLVFSIHEQLLKRWLSERESKKYERIVGKK